MQPTSTIKSTKKCKHTAAIPYEYEFGKRVKDPSFGRLKVDWFSTSQNAHTVRVKSIFCFSCNRVIDLTDLIK